MGCWLCGFGEFCLWAFVSSTVKENTTTTTCIIRSFYASGASNSEAGTWQAHKCQVSWLGLSTPPSPQEACPKEPNPSLQELLGHQSQDAGPEFPVSLGGLPSLPGGCLPSPLMGVSHPPLGGLLSPLESPLGGSPISSGGLLSPLEGVYHPPLGRSPVSPRGSPLGCLPFLLGCTALRRMILAHFCPLLPVRPLHSSGPA